MQIYKNLSLKNLPGEEWRPVPDNEECFVSNLGRIKRRNSIISQSLSTKGYPSISPFIINGKKYSRPHRIVGLLFIPNPNNYNEINHIDSDKANNSASNLEWCTRSHNMKHMIRETGPGHRIGMTNPKATIVLHTEYGVYCTMREAAAMIGLKDTNFNHIMYETGYRKNKTKFIFA